MSLTIFVGYQKAGSTFLGNIVRNCGNIRHVKPPSLPNLDGDVYLHQLFRVITRSLFAMDEAFAKEVIKKVDIATLFNSDEVIFLSLPIIRPSNLEVGVRRLSEIFGSDTQIILSIRRQYEHLFSRYNHDIGLYNLFNPQPPKPSIRRHPIKRFLVRKDKTSPLELPKLRESLSEEIMPCDYPLCIRGLSAKVPVNVCQGPCFVHGMKVLSLPFYDYDRTYLILSKYFDRISVHPVEEMRDEPIVAVTRLLEFIGGELDDGARKAITNKSIINSGEYSKWVRDQLSDVQFREMILERYKESNNSLADRTGLELEKFGYF